VRDNLSTLGYAGLIDSAELGVSELVTNACLHARTPMTVVLRLLAADVIRIEVSDDSPRQPELRDYAAMSTTGRGLRLLSAYGVWGVLPPPGAGNGKTVWFEPAADTAPDGAHLDGAAAVAAGPTVNLDEWPDL
jgi:hypothetical protein